MDFTSTQLSRSEVLSLRHVPSMFVLALAAGAVNAGAFVLGGNFVSHVTGSVTRVGLEAGESLAMGPFVTVLAPFILGAMASVFAIQARTLRGRRAAPAIPLFGTAFVLLCLAALGKLGLFGAPGQDTPAMSYFLGALSFGLGMMNATVASSTAVAVRTTHMTGPASDFGVSLVVAFFSIGPDRADAFRIAFLRGGKVVSFLVGASLMVPCVASLGFAALMFPAAAISFATFRTFTSFASVPSTSATSSSRSLA